MTVVTLWGTRGSIAAPGPETEHYGGNTSCIQVTGREGTVLILDAGTGLRRLGRTLPPDMRRVDILLTHLHMDHLQGLGFFGALRNPSIEVHIWGPASTTLNLQARLTRYLSPPFFPVLLRDLPRMPVLHEVPCAEFDVGEFHVHTSLVNHPGPTVGYRVESAAGVLAYMPDHEPAMGVQHFPIGRDWTSGYSGRARRGPADPRHTVHSRGVRRARGLGPQLDPARARVRAARADAPSDHLPSRSGSLRRRPRTHHRRGAGAGPPALLRDDRRRGRPIRARNQGDPKVID